MRGSIWDTKPGETWTTAVVGIVEVGVFNYPVSCDGRVWKVFIFDYTRDSKPAIGQHRAFGETLDEALEYCERNFHNWC